MTTFLSSNWSCTFYKQFALHTINSNLWTIQSFQSHDVLEFQRCSSWRVRKFYNNCISQRLYHQYSSNLANISQIDGMLSSSYSIIVFQLFWSQSDIQINAVWLTMTLVRVCQTHIYVVCIKWGHSSENPENLLNYMQNIIIKLYFCIKSIHSCIRTANDLPCVPILEILIAMFCIECSNLIVVLPTIHSIGMYYPLSTPWTV